MISVRNLNAKGKLRKDTGRCDTAGRNDRGDRKVAMAETSSLPAITRKQDIDSESEEIKTRSIRC